MSELRLTIDGSLKGHCVFSGVWFSGRLILIVQAGQGIRHKLQVVEQIIEKLWNKDQPAVLA